VESSRYAEYQRICDVSEPKDTALADGSLRVACPVFPEVLVFSIIPQLVTLPEFPLSPMGLIHYKTVVTVFKEIPIGASLDFHMHIDGHRETDRGIEVDIIMEARFNATDEIVWKCVETVLSRNKSRGKKATGPAEKPAEEPEIWKQVTFSVPANMGLKYAKVSGDYNPYHCYPLAAKLFGFKRAIAHGMWSMERCVSELRAAGVCPTQLPLVIESQFKLPVYLPSDVLLSFTTKSDAVATTEFKLTSPDGKLPYVAGKVYMMSQ
jgi:acyl dehydratase